MRAAKRAISLVALLIAAGALAAVAHERITYSWPPIVEKHGKPTVKLTERFRLKVPFEATGVAWSPDGTVLAVEGSAGDGTVLMTLRDPDHILSKFKSDGYLGPLPPLVAFINGSSQVLFGLENAKRQGQNAAMDIRDVATGRILDTLTADYITTHFAVSPDQKRIAISGAGDMSIYEQDGQSWQKSAVISGMKVRDNRWVGFETTSLSFFPDGRLLARGGRRGRFQVVDSTSGKTVREFQIPGVRQDVEAIAASPDGALLLVGVIKDDIESTSPLWGYTGASIWRIKDGDQIAFLKESKFEGVRQAAWDPQNRFVAFIDNDSLVVWQPALQGENVIRIKYPYLTVSLAISRDGKSLAVATDRDKVIVYTID